MDKNIVSYNNSDKLMEFLMEVRVKNNLKAIEIPELDERIRLKAMGIRRKTREELDDLNIKLVLSSDLETSYSNRDLENLKKYLELLFLYPITLDQFYYMLDRMDSAIDPISQLVSLVGRKANCQPLNAILLLKD